MTVIHDIRSRFCVRCGKEITVLHPDMWAYKTLRGTNATYWCSWKCKRESEAEKEKENGMKKLTLEDKKEAVKIALAGGNPFEYLKMCGIVNTAEAWHKIKTNLKEKDPATYARLPKRLPTTRDEEAPADEVTKAALQHPERPIVQPISPVVMEVPEKPAKITRPLAYGGFTVRAIEGTFGKFSAYELGKDKYFNYESADGHEELDMTIDQWKAFLKELRKAAAVLGVEL